MSSSVNEKLIGALTSYVSGEIAPARYEGDASSYIVFSLEILPVLNADNVPHATRNLISFNYRCPYTTDTVETVKQMAKSLVAAGFTYPDVMDLSDDEQQLIHFESEIEEGIEWQA